jgi:two-component system cell cycle sensor histidine kinase/response regulator CckA
VDSATIQAAFALAPIGVTITRDGVTEYCNPTYLRMFGYEGHESEIYGKSLLAMVAPEAREVILQRIQSRSHGDPTDTSYDSVGLRRDGTTFPFHVAAHRVSLADGPATLAYFVDITDRQRAEEELRHSNELLGALIRCCPVPITLMDPQGRVLLWNLAAERTFGWNESDVLGRPMPIVAPADDSEFHANLSRAMAGGIEGVEARRQRKDGTPVDIAIWAAPVRDVRGQSVGVIALTVDITERKHTAEALHRSQEQLRHAQKMEAVGRLAGGVAHDFNNVLTAISGFAELLRLQVRGQETAEASVSEIQRSVERAAALTRQLLAFSRQQAVRPTALDLNEIVGNMDRMLSRLLSPGVRLESRLSPELGRVRGDTSQIEQVITNLVVNANDAMPTGGNLALSTNNVVLSEPLLGSRFVIPPGSYVVLEVTDTGTGMDEAVISRLFDPFFTTKDRGKGTGLGLSTVYGIVTQSGGHVHVESQIGKGSTFRVYFPLVDEQPAAVESPTTRATDGGAGTVLAVEDDAMLLSLIGGMLERNGYHVLTAPDAERALSLLAEAHERIDLLLSDVLMPGLSGAELAQRAWELDPDLPVIFMSGYADPTRFPAEVRERASGYVAKPFQSETLLHIMAEVLSRRGRSADPG